MATRKKTATGGSDYRFVKLYEDWCDHPKTIEAGDAACGAWSRIVAYTSRTMRAHVPEVMALQYAFSKQSNLDRLVEVGLLTADGAGYRVHDWEIWQAELFEITESKRKRIERASRGGKAKAEQAAAKQPQADSSRIRQIDKTAEAAIPTGEMGDSEIWQTETKTKTKTKIETDLSGSANDCSRQGSEQIRPAPAATPAPPVGEFGEFDRDRSWALVVETWRNAGPRSDERDLTSAFRLFEREIDARNWPDFAQRVSWAVEASLTLGDRGPLGVLYTFIRDRWRQQQPPFKAATKVSAPAVMTVPAGDCFKV